MTEPTLEKVKLKYENIDDPNDPRVLMQLRNIRKSTRQRFREYTRRNSLKPQATLERAVNLLEREERRAKR